MSFSLSEEAQRAHDAEGPILVLGGPGSGKTTLALLKAKAMVENLEPGQKILFLSFSRAAVHQVEVRCRTVLAAADRERISVKTYHAFCMEQLRSHGRLLRGQSSRVLHPGTERRLKSSHVGDWDAEARRLADGGAYTFGQFAPATAELLASRKCVRDLISDRYPVVILDEFQDTDDAQWAMVQQLALRSRLLVLADPDQRIFDYDPTVDPERLEQLRESINPAEFDLGLENHRSPGSGILLFADAILKNRPLPDVPEVKTVSIYANAFDSTAHAAIVWTLSELRKAGIKRPSLAVLARTNAVVERLSKVLDGERLYGRTLLKPVPHSVAWDAELAAASAAVVSSILEWPQLDPTVATAQTLDTIAEFYETKFADGAAKSARASADQYIKAATQHRSGGKVTRAAAIQNLLAAGADGIALTGNPVADWKQAQAILEACGIDEVYSNSRFVRLFQASGEIGPQLHDRWVEAGDYGNARDIVRRAIDRARLIAVTAEQRGVMLMNIHKSKGKEFDGVVLVEGTYGGAFYSVGRDEEAPYFPSRRVLRVGITRARSRVFILRSNQAPPLTGIY